jgi:hypothetical protein
MGKRRVEAIANGELPDPERTGIFTTGIISMTKNGPIAIYITGRNHAGENLAGLLEQRDAGEPTPLLMSDALDRNLPRGHEVDWANCVCHGRRHIVDEVQNYPAECRHILLELKKVFKVEAYCKRHRLSEDERLRLHQERSKPVMDGLEKWLKALVAEKRIEPNSGMGQAIGYLLKRWQRFCRFLVVPGAPIGGVGRWRGCGRRPVAVRRLSIAAPQSGLPWPRFQRPLVELDMQISRIQLSSRSSRLRSRLAA